MLSETSSRQFLKYLAAAPTRRVRALFFSTTILDFALAAITIFEPIYLFKIGYSIPRILLFYIAIYGLYFAIQPFGGKVTRSHGYEHGIMFSTPFLILYYLSLFAIPYSPLFAVVAVIAYALQKMLYWPGYHADFARFGSVSNRGKELGKFIVLLSLASILGPFFGGLILKFFSFPTLFVIVSFLILASNVPLLLKHETLEPRELSYWDAYKRVLKPENRRLVLAYIGYGEEFLAIIVWPLAMYAIVGHFAALGLIVSVGMVFTAIVGYIIGCRTDEGEGRKFLRIGALFTALSWAARITIASPIPVFGIDVLYRSSRMAQGTPMAAMTYNQAREYSVTKTALLMEAAVIIGKLTAAVFALVAFQFFPDYAWPFVFVLGAAYSLMYLIF